MRLLVVMARYPFPPRTGSAIVASNHLAELSKRHALDLVCLVSSEDVQTSLEFFERVEFILHRKSFVLIRWLRATLGMLGGTPPSVSALASKSMKDTVQHLVQTGVYDAMLLFEMGAIQYCPTGFLSRAIINIEDPQSLRLERMAQLPTVPLYLKCYWLFLAKMTASYEKRTLNQTGRVFALSEADVHDMMVTGVCDRISHLPYGVGYRERGVVFGYQGRDRAIVFSGNMFHPANVDGAIFLLADIFPLVLKAIPDAVLWIVGADPDKRIVEAAAAYQTNVLVTGRVADVGDYLNRAMVSVCPIRLKIGVQTKILESLSWGAPVVTTSAGNSGVVGASGVNLWVADDAKLFAQRICDLFNRQCWEEFSEKGKGFVLDRFSWEGSAKKLEESIMALNSSVR